MKATTNTNTNGNQRRKAIIQFGIVVEYWLDACTEIQMDKSKYLVIVKLSIIYQTANTISAIRMDLLENHI